MSVNATDRLERGNVSDNKDRMATFFGPFVDPDYITFINRVLYGAGTGVTSHISTERRVSEWQD